MTDLTLLEKQRNEYIKQALAYHVHNPSQQSVGFIELANYLANGNKLNFGNRLDDFLRPQVGGDLTIVLGRTGHGKTSFSAALALNMAKRIKNGTLGDEDSIIVFATLEQQVEYIEAMFYGNWTKYDSSQLIRGEVPEEAYAKYATKRPSLPIWVIGESRRNAGIMHSELYFETIVSGIEGIFYEYGKRPAVIFVDYLQQCRMRDGSWDNKHKQVMAASMALKQLAMRFDTPVIAGSQAKQEVDDYKDKMPKLKDSMWAADATHQADTVIGIMRPARYNDPEEVFEVEVNKKFFSNSDEMLIVSILKQRFAPGWGTLGMRFIPQKLILEDTQSQNYNDVRQEEIPF